MKTQFRSAVELLSLGVLVVGVCLLPGRVLASTVGSSGTGDASGSVSATTACATNGGSFGGGLGILLLDENLGPVSGSEAVQCDIASVILGTVAINDPPTIDGGAVSDILTFTADGTGGTFVSLSSVGENGFTQAMANADAVGALAITEFNVSGGVSGYTVYDSGNPSANGGLGSCVFSSTGSTLTLTGCANNAYIINSNTDERAAEPTTLLLLLVVIAAFGLASRKRLSAT